MLLQPHGKTEWVKEVLPQQLNAKTLFKVISLYIYPCASFHQAQERSCLFRNSSFIQISRLEKSQPSHTGSVGKIQLIGYPEIAGTGYI